ncbi:hypothetical protein Micbo1qcDRAFT_169775, partial [Microdochium bolleyi]
MPSKPRFFVLQKPLPATDTTSLLGRVVESKKSPQGLLTPQSLPGVPLHTNNLTLPEPTVSTHVIDRATVIKQRSIYGRLSTRHKAELHSYKEQYEAFECDKLTHHTLPNPQFAFRDLMTNDQYAANVRPILERAWPWHAYLVTGFLVAVNAKWTTQSTTERGAGASASTSNGQYRELIAAGENVIALSYSLVRPSVSLTTTAPFVTKKFRIGAPVRAKTLHKFIGDESKEFVVEDSAEKDLS